MGKKRIIKLILIFIIVCLAFQMIPTFSVNNSGLQGHVKNETAIFSVEAHYPGIAYFGRQDYKSLLYKLQLTNTVIILNQISLDEIYSANFSFQEMPFDYRTVIRQSIPHYFNGSKYRISHFDI